MIPKRIKYYILTINIANTFDRVLFEKKLNLAIAWVQIMPNVFIIKSRLDKKIWFDRMQTVLGKECLFFICETELENYTGWLYKSRWDWIHKHKKTI